MVSRRDFMKITGTVAGTAAASLAGVDSACASGYDLDHDRIGVLTDYTQCIGCRRCEWACAQENGLPFGELDSCDDQSVFEELRRPDEKQFTVVNRYPAAEGSDKPLDVKVNCLHCEHPACVSACPVQAFKGVEFKASDPVEARFDTRACEEYRLTHPCGLCVAKCPVGRPSKSKR